MDAPEAGNGWVAAAISKGFLAARGAHRLIVNVNPLRIAEFMLGLPGCGRSGNEPGLEHHRTANL
jgi:hypothetical protein